jgi:hypothetical protein
MTPYEEIYARIEHMKELWRELQRTPRTGPTYGQLIENIRTESTAYLSLVDAQAGVAP